MFALILARSMDKGIVWLPPKFCFTWNLAHAHINDGWSGNAIWKYLQNTSKVLKKHMFLFLMQNKDRKGIVFLIIFGGPEKGRLGR